MRVTLQRLVESQGTLLRLCGLPWAAKCVKASYALGKALRAVEREVGEFNDHRNELVKRFGEELDDGSEQWRVKDENMKDFAESLNGLLSAEVEINVVELKLEAIEGANVEIKPQELALLDWLITE